MVETLVSERKNILEFDTNSLLKILINEVGLYYTKIEAIELLRRNWPRMYFENEHTDNFWPILPC